MTKIPNLLMGSCAGLVLIAGTLNAQYKVVDVSPAPADGVKYYARGGTAAQQVGGVQSAVFAPYHALLLSNNGATVVDLHPTTLTPDSPYYGIPGAVTTTPSVANSSDGVSQVGSFINTAVMWKGTPDSMMNLHPGQYNASEALAVSGSQQVGWATAPVSGGGHRGAQTTFYAKHAILWQSSPANFVDLHPAGFDETYATSLASGGYQAGVGITNGQNKALVWFGSAASVTNLHPQAFTSSVANGVNGLVIGTGTITKSGKGGALTSIDHALLWFGSANNYVDLHPAGFVNSYGLAITLNKQVGYGTLTDATGTHNHALAWANSVATVVDLNQFLPAGFTDAVAVAIDYNGAIVGNASGIDGRQHQMLWIPQ